MTDAPDPNPGAEPAPAGDQASDSQREIELALGDGAAPGLADREYRFYRSTIRWLGSVAIASVLGVVVMGLCGHATTASSLVAVATAAVAGMAAVFK